MNLPPKHVLAKNQQLFERAGEALARGDLREAGRDVDAMLDAWPGDPFGRHLRAVIRVREGRLSEAVHLLENVLRDAPAFADAWSDLGAAHRLLGNLEAAESALREGLRIDPDRLALLTNLITVLLARKKPAECRSLLDRARRIEPENGVVWMLESEVFALAGAPDEAWSASDRALAILERALVQRPGNLDLHHRLASLHRARAENDDAERHLRAAVEARPQDALMRTEWSLTLLAQGKHAAGWAAYESRFAMPEPIPRRVIRGPVWDGAAGTGRLRVVHEQGLGDLVQFARFFPRVRSRCRSMVAEVPAPARTLLSRAFPDIEFQESGPATDHDVWCSLMSLPHLLRIERDEECFSDPYIPVPEVTRATGGPRRVGLVWAGNPGHIRDAFRSIDPRKLAGLFEIPGLAIESLQVGVPVPEELAFARVHAPEGLEKTVEILAGLDLVVSVDTMVAHLAGAMGRPVWTLIAEPADWRWGCRGTATHWYGSMRLFRQARPGCWKACLQDLKQALQEFAAGP